MITSNDISRKIDRVLLDALIAIEEAAQKSNAPFIIVGATARDIIFQHIFGLPPERATMDIDIAVRVNSWIEYDKIQSVLINSGKFERENPPPRRLRFGKNLIIDVIPFGGLEKPAGEIAWPPSEDIVMSTVGFEEALRSSMKVKISNNPDIFIHVVTPAALAILKLISWNEKPAVRSKDAIDFYFIMKNYADAGNQDRLFSTDQDLLFGENFDYAIASTRLLGRDMKRICGERTRNLVEVVLKEETNEHSQLHLVVAMAKNEFDKDESYNHALLMLSELYLQFKGK